MLYRVLPSSTTAEIKKFFLMSERGRKKLSIFLYKNSKLKRMSEKENNNNIIEL
jgi:hypothetical protein